MASGSGRVRGEHPAVKVIVWGVVLPLLCSALFLLSNLFGIMPASG